MTAQTPCEADPDKWFIDRDGRKFDEELLVTEDEIRAAMAELADDGIAAVAEDVEDIVAALMETKVKSRMVERRHARDACHTECRFRLQCLDKALTNHEQYGIWGGYFPEQRRELEREIDRRAARRATPS